MDIHTTLQHADDVHQWIGEFSQAELQAHGWMPETLLNAALTNSTVLGYDGGRLVAGLIYYPVDRDQCEVLFLATAPQSRRKGYQKQLLLHFFKANPSCGLWLECRADNAAAIALYTQCGFQETGRRLRYYKDGMDAILMSFFPPERAD